jgi:hypothetical protein
LLENKTGPNKKPSHGRKSGSHNRPKQKTLTEIWLQTKIVAANESAEQRKVNARTIFWEKHSAGERLQKSVDVLELSPGGGGSDEEIGNGKADRWRRANTPDRNKQRGKIGLIEGKMKIDRAGPGRTQQENLRSRTNTK